MRPGYFADRTVTDLAAGLRSGTVTSAELTERALESIARLDATLGAFVAVCPDDARAAARRADAELTAGTDRGPLHGVPVGVKDMIDVAGLPTTMGSAHCAGRLPARDAECVRRLRAAGAVIVGKTTTHEFAYGPTGDRSANGPSRNPHDPARMSGGSSGGSAVAVAAGMVPLALGTDTGGSVRIPAALCGVAGFKPAYGAVPVDGVFPLASSLDVVGVLARTARDCRAAYHVLAGPPAGPGRTDPGPGRTDPETGGTGTGPGRTDPETGRTDPETGEAGAGTGETIPRPGGAGSCRVGWVRPSALSRTSRDVERAVRAALDRAGVAVEDVALPGADAVRAAYSAIQDSEAYAVHADRVERRPELFDPEVLDRLRHAARTPGWRYVRALADRSRLRGEICALLDRYDLLALPTTPIVAPALGEREVDIDGRPAAVRPALLALTSPWNVLGLPALSVPAGTAAGLPVGLQLVTGPGHEDRLFALASRIGAAER